MTAILLTGFEPFHRWRVNSSWEAVSYLAGRMRGVAAAQLPVDHARAADAVLELAKGEGRAIILLTGLADCPVPRLEMVGRAGPLSGRGGPVLRRGRWPWGEAQAAAAARGLPVRLSGDAGGYVCDTTYWAVLGTAVPLVGFLHLPPVGAVWTPARSARVVEAVLSAVVAD